VHPALRPYVASMVGYHDHLDPDAVHHGLPSPYATVIIAVDAPIDVGWLGRPETQAEHWTMASGLHPAPALIRTHGYQHGMQIGLTPRGVRALLGLPAGAIAAHLVDLDDLPFRLPATTADRIRASDSWTVRFAALEDHLLRVLRRSEDPVGDLRPEVGEAWRLIRRSRGRMAVEEVAGRVGWTRRYLAPRFSAEYGLGPKQAARLCRFTFVRGLAESGRPLADAAVEAGYADQAHLSREWRELAGRTPTQWLVSPYHLAPDAPGAEVQDRPVAALASSSP
jgi:AraC-like DNA-binding protein